MNPMEELPTAPPLDEPSFPRPWSTTLVWAAISSLVGGAMGAVDGWSWVSLSEENRAHCARMTINSFCGGMGFVLIDLPVTVAAVSIVASAVAILALTIAHLHPRTPLILACLTMPALSAFAYRLLIPDPGLNPDPRGVLIPTIVMAAGFGCTALLSRLHYSPVRPV